GTYDDGVLCRFEDMGFFGEGSLAFQFLLQKDIMYTPSSQPDEIWLEADFGMHSNGPFECTRQRAQGAICLEIP
ncbi:MAG: hypothetical protein NTU41_01085, partial [Chloroflexi bacterium]|nr:hypothetical protein [Chloroflexota bacterium]